MAISTNGTVLTRLAGALYNTQMSNATYSEVKALDPATLADALYARDFSASTDAAVATTLVTNLGLASVTGLNNWVAAQLTAAGSHKGAKIVDLLNSFAQMTADTTYGSYATAFNTKVDAALAASQTTGNAGGTFAAAGVVTVANATFTLSSSIDAIVGGAGNDTINGTATTLSTNDSIDGGAGTDSLAIVDIASALGGALPTGLTVTGVENVAVTTSGKIGTHATASVSTTTGAVEAAAGSAGAAVITTAYVGTTAGDITLTYDGVTYTSSSPTVGSTANAVTAIAALVNSTPLGRASTVTTGTGTVTITANTLGASIPAFTIAGTMINSAETTAAVVNTAGVLPKLATGAQQQIQQIVLGGTLASTDTYTLNYTTGSATVANLTYTGNSTTAAATAIAAQINSLYGSTIATAANSVVTIQGAAGVVLPAMSITMGGASVAATATSTILQSPAIATSAGTTTSTTAVSAAAFDVSGFTGTTGFTGTSVGGANLKAASTTAVTETNTGGGLVKVATGADITVKNNDSVEISGAKGAVSVTVSAAPTATNSVLTAAGVTVTGGTTVSVTEAGTSNATAITIGAAPSAASGVTTTGYPQVITDLAKDPTGNVTTYVATTSTNATSGLADVVFGTGVQTIYTNGADTVSVTGAAGALTIKDVQTTALKSSSTATAVPGTSKLATVKVAGLSGLTAGTITSDAFSNLQVTDSSYTGTLTIANSGATGVNAGALNLTVGNISGTGMTVADATATSVAISTVNSAYQAIGGTAVSSTSASTVALTAAAATSLSVAGTSQLTLASSTLTNLASITDTSAGRLNLGDVTGYSKLATINASGASGALTATIGATGTTYGLNVTGGSGADTITLKNGSSGSNTSFTTGLTATGSSVTTNVNLGAGNDNLLAGGAYITVDVGTALDGGDGTDTVSASLINAGNASLFKNFEVLEVTGNTATYDLSLLTNSTISGLAFGTGTTSSTTAGSGTSSVIGLASNSTVAVNSFTNQASLATGYLQNITQTHVTGAATTAVTFASAATSGTTNYSVLGTLTSNNDTAISIASGGGSYVAGNGINTIAETTNTLTTVSISGSKAFTLGAVTTNTAGTITANTASVLTTIDGSAATGALTITAGGDQTLGSYKMTYTGLTITGGSGADAITINAKNGVVNGGAGADTITTGNLSITSDIVTVNGGAGADTLVPQVTYQSAATSSSAATTGSYTVFADATTGDVIKFPTVANSTGALGAKVSVAAASTFDQAVFIASGSGTSTNGTITWFQYGGNTYIVDAVKVTGETVDGVAGDSTAYNGTGSTGNSNANDIVVKLAGLVDLSTAAMVTSTNGTLTFA